MKKVILLSLFISTVLSTSATISWMGNHTTSTQPTNSQTIHFYIEMYDRYSGTHTEVCINEGGTWTKYTLTQGADNGGNSTWSADIVVKSYATAYYFHGWDDWNANVYDNNGSANYSISMKPTTAADGNWNVGTSWCDGTTPSSTSASYVIAHNITLDKNVTVGALIINTGKTLTASDGNARTLTISKSGSGSTTTLTNNGNWTNGTGGSTVIFTGTPSSGDAIQATSGSIAFQNVTISKSGGTSNIGASFGTNSSVTGTLEIGTGGYISTAPPTSFYGANAILKFNQGSGSTYDVNASDFSWSTTVIPNYITISSGTVNLNADRTASGNLLIDGGTLILNSNTPNLTIQGNWTRSSGVFTANSGTVTLSGAGSSIVNVAGSSTMNNLIISKTSDASVSLQSPLVTSTLTINSGATLNVNAAQTLTVNNTFNNSGTLNLLSNASGTATILTPATIGGTGGSYTIQQYLESARNWYMASPVNGATVPTGKTYYSYDETGSNTNPADQSRIYWVALSEGTLLSSSAIGFIVQSTSTSTQIFSGTGLNTGTINTPTLTRTTDTTKLGFNLVGNPYPSYVNGRTAVNSVANLEKSIWYRTQNTSNVYVFETYNTLSGLGTNNSLKGAAIGTIPPMQAFWVRVSSGSATLSFNNALRTHKTDTINPFKVHASKNAEQQIIRLQVSNGTSKDETILMANPNAADGYDAYDSPKFTNSAIPEIYTLLNSEEIAINGMSSIPLNTEIPLGFSTNKASDFTIKATEITNFDPNTKVIIKDNTKEYDITNGDVYQFASGVTNTASRFSIIFKTADTTTNIDNKNEDTNIQISRNTNHQITINYTGNTAEKATVSIHNIIGQTLKTEKLSRTTVINRTFKPGIYLVIIDNGTKTTTLKTAIN